MKLILFYIGFVLVIQGQVGGFLFGRRRRRRRRRSPAPRDCVPSEWTQWSTCSHQCGNAGTQTRTRYKKVTDCCGGRCPYQFTDSRPCNRDACRNGGRPTHGGCNCNAGWTGTCCESDFDECQTSPCQHICHNVPGSYTCSCHSCYTKVGTRCELRQCKIGGVCYSYGRVKPGNQCQDCQKTRETIWTNNDALSCSDGKLCTRLDRCVNGVCKGTPFTCRSCERCDGNGCKIKPGFCVINGECYTNGNIRPGKPCQQCNSNLPSRWTANNNLKCSDGNVKTRNDRCVDGKCTGQPFTCLPCQEHYNDACRLKPGYCIIKHKNENTCYAAKTANPGNTCQWCHPAASTSAWTNRNGISCDDRDKCTKSDTCKNGQCGGITFECNDLCQYCDGSGCSPLAGFGYVAGVCTCKIAGKNYNDQQLNPSNECQWCDLQDKPSKSRSVWASTPAKSCNDRNACTTQDRCHNGRCVGKAYTCPSSYKKSSCIQRSQCVGDGTCKHIMRNKGTICRKAEDQCDQPERCNGVWGTCPPRIVDAIKLQTGQATLTLSDFATPVSFQAITDKLYLKLAGFSVTCGALNIKWSLLKKEDICSLGKKTSILPSTNNNVLTGLTLQNGEAYKVVVQTSDIRGQSGLPVCSNLVTIDTSKPTGGWIRDGLDSTDVQFQSSKTISAIWGGFKTTHGMAKYETAVYYKSTGSNSLLQPFTNVNLDVSFSKTFTTIADGNKIITKIRAYTKAGLYSEISSDGVTVDTSQPNPGTVSDGSTVSSDIRYANWTTAYYASWIQFTDPHTAIVEYKVGVKRKNGGLVSSGLSSVGLKRVAKVSRLNLESGVEYCAIVKGVNAAGLNTQATSNCILIDHEAPLPGTVNDGTSEDIDHQSEDKVFHGNWNGFDDGQKGSGVAEYKYKLTDKNNIDITEWASSGLRTAVTIRGLNLVNGYVYYLTVRAIDSVGNYKDVKSDGAFIDTSHPVYKGSINVQGELAQKNGKTVVYIRNKNSFTVSWPQFVDEHSGMNKYQWAIVEKNVQPTLWNDVPGVNLGTKAFLRSLSLKNNEEYQLTIRGINNAGLHTDIQSPIVIPLSTPPGLGIVSDGNNLTTDIDYQTNRIEVSATWKGFETPNVKVRAYFFAIGSCMGGNYHVTNNQFIPVNPPTATSFGVRGLHLVNGQRYCVKIKAENLAGLQTDPISSDGFIVDMTPPNIERAVVLDGSGDDDIDFQSSRGELSATWIGIQDHDSGVKRFEVAVSRNRVQQPDVTSFRNVGQNTSAKISGLNLHKDVYHVIVCAINNAGLKSCLASDGVLIDPTVSTPGVVHDGILEPDIRYQSSTTKMSANWERIWDLESRVEGFEWGIGEEYPGSVLDFVNVGLQTHVTTNKVLALRHSHNYTVYLRVYNRAGGVLELTSNGVTIDTTPPIPSGIYPDTYFSKWRFVQETNAYYSSTPSGIYVAWREYKEPESEIWYYKWGIGTSKCGTQLQPLINIGLNTHANTSGSKLDLRPGVSYYVIVVARNRADLASRACSPPLIFDYTPPLAGIIRITSHTGTEKSYFRFDQILRVSWSDFEDFESGIKNYDISVLQSDTSMVNYTLNSWEVSLNVSLNILSANTTYTISINAINYVGLETKVYSKPFTIDNTSPVYTGNESDLPRRRYQSHSDSLKVTWDQFEDYESPVEYYQVGIGTKATRDDISQFTKNDLCRNFEFVDLKLKDHQLYYVTVRATNTAGLVTSLVLEAVFVDKTPPAGPNGNGSVADGISGPDIDYVSLIDPVSATWENIEDLESGIDMFEYCIGTSPFNCLMKPFTSVNQNKSFVCPDCKIPTDMKVYARIRATNGAGLSAIFTSDGVMKDSSTPEIGRVLDGDKAEAPDVEKVDRDWHPVVTWYGAQDIQSGLRECKWIIEKHDGNAKEIVYEQRLENANTTYNIRHTERVSGSLQLIKNTSYSNVIRCWNNVGITSFQYSNGWSVVEQWPTTSHVFDGLELLDMEYDIVGETLGASWGAFYGDSKDPVIGYEWAVGTLEAPEDIMEFREVGLDTRASHSLSDSESELNPGVRYYVTVRASSLSGKTRNKSSNGFILDKTRPTGGALQVSHNIINQNTFNVDYILTWNGFSDLETGIRSYEFCLGYIKDVCSTVVTSASLNRRGTVQHFKHADTARPFYGIVMATNFAGLKTTVSSNAIKIDFKPPVAGKVIDGVDKDFDYINASVPLVTTWSAFTDPETGIKRCTLTITEENPVVHASLTPVFRKAVNASGSIIHTFILIPGLKYISTIECENADGFKSTASSNGVIVDTSPPIVGSIFHGTKQNTYVRYQSSMNSLEMYWNPGHDPESGIKEYSIAVGSGPHDDDIHRFFDVGIATDVKIGNLTMDSGKTYYVTLEVVNSAGLRSRVSSSGITVDETLPKITKVQLESSQTSPGFIGPESYLSGNWNTYDDESSIDFTEYCIGTTMGGCQTHDMQRVTDNHTTVTCFECRMKHGHTYFMTIRVFNKAGLFSLATTEGVTVDLTPPTAGKVSLNELYMPCLGTCRLIATYSGFIDEETGIKACQFSIKTANGEMVTPQQAITNENHIMTANLTLKHGKSYKIAVSCTNNLLQRSVDIDSSEITIDNTPPEKGLVIISPDANHDTRRQHTGCHFLNTTIRVYWTGFYDKESPIAGFRVAIGRKLLGYDVISFQNVNMDSEANFELDERYGLSRGDIVFATVEATNEAGLLTKVSSLPTRLISDTESNLLNERDFICGNF